MRTQLKVLIGLCLFVFIQQARAFDWVNKKTSYLENKYLSFNLKMGVAQLIQDSRVSSDHGFSLHVGLAHQLNQYLQAELFYQYGFFDLKSPDALNTANTFTSDADLHETGLRFLLMYPAVALKPYIAAGVGGYGIDNASETALQFDFNLEVPLSAGFQAYIYKDIISLDFDFTYNFLFGQNQSKDVLNLLNIKEVNFNSYAATLGMQFHFF